MHCQTLASTMAQPAVGARVRAPFGHDGRWLAIQAHGSTMPNATTKPTRRLGSPT